MAGRPPDKSKSTWRNMVGASRCPIEVMANIIKEAMIYIRC